MYACFFILSYANVKGTNSIDMNAVVKIIFIVLNKEEEEEEENSR